jgi:hypothetical protein
MEGVQCHLSGRFADGLGCSASDCLSGLHHAAIILEGKDFLEFFVKFEFVNSFVGSFGNGAHVVRWRVFLLDGDVLVDESFELLLLEFVDFSGLYEGLEFVVLELGLEGISVVLQQVQLAEELVLGWIQRILTV